MPANAQRGGVDRDRRGGSSASRAVAALDRQLRGRTARGTTVRRAGAPRRRTARRPSVMSTCVPGRDLGQRHACRDQRRDPRRHRPRRPRRAASMRSKLSPCASVATSSSRGRSGALGERPTTARRAHPPAAVGAERERHDHLAAEFVAHRVVEPHRGRGLERGEIGPAGQRRPPTGRATCRARETSGASRCPRPGRARDRARVERALGALAPVVRSVRRAERSARRGVGGSGSPSDLRVRQRGRRRQPPARDPSLARSLNKRARPALPRAGAANATRSRPFPVPSGCAGTKLTVALNPTSAIVLAASGSRCHIAPRVHGHIARQ